MSLGRAIFAWLNGDDGLIEQIRGQARPPFVVELIVPKELDEPAKRFLEVPWEILADDRGFLAENENLLYCPVRRVGPAVRPQDPSDHWLSAVFMAASPEGVKPVLSYEAEETALLGVAQPIRMDLTVEPAPPRMDSALGLELSPLARAPNRIMALFVAQRFGRLKDYRSLTLPYPPSCCVWRFPAASSGQTVL